MEGTDYTVSYEDNVNAGTAMIMITGTGNYTGEITRVFEIKAVSITDATVELSEENYTYDGQEKTPDVTVILNDGTVLTENTDYTVAYHKDDAAFVSAIRNPKIQEKRAAQAAGIF